MSCIMAITVSPTHKTYLQFCEEELNPNQEIPYHQASTHYQIADAVSACVLSAFSLCSVVVAALYAPVFVPLTLFVSAFLLKQASDIHQCFTEWATQAEERAKQIVTVRKNYEEIKNYKPHQTQQILHDKGI